MRGPVHRLQRIVHLDMSSSMYDADELQSQGAALSRLQDILRDTMFDGVVHLVVRAITDAAELSIG